MSESPGEDFLKERGLIRRSSEQRQRILGCVGCLWSKEIAKGNPPTMYGRQILQCTGLKAGTVYPILQKLETVGAMESAWEDVEPHTEARPPRRLYKPVHSELGASFATSIEAQEATCDLTQPKQEQDDDPATIRRAVASRFITTATIEELRWLKEQAEEQITLLEEK